MSEMTENEMTENDARKVALGAAAELLQAAGCTGLLLEDPLIVAGLCRKYTTFLRGKGAGSRMQPKFWAARAIEIQPGNRGLSSEKILFSEVHPLLWDKDKLRVLNFWEIPEDVYLELSGGQS